MAVQLQQLQTKRQLLVTRLQQQRVQQEQKRKQAQAPPPPLEDDGEVEILEVEQKSLEETLREKAEAAEAKGELIDLLDSDDEGPSNVTASTAADRNSAGGNQSQETVASVGPLIATAFNL
jgi:hypothetical protein